MKTKEKIATAIVFIVLCLLAVVWIYPIFMILINSLKGDTFISTSTVFQLPNANSYVGLENYVNALSSKGFAAAFGYSLVITITSDVLILVCTAMCAWYITRVRNKITKCRNHHI